MQKNMRFQVLFDGYFKDLYEFYKIIPSISTNNGGVIIFDKISIIYENFLYKEIIKPSMLNCQLEVYTDENIFSIEKKILNTKSQIISKEYYLNSPYILTKDPTGLKVKINFTKKKNISCLKIPYMGRIEKIDTFYNALGINSINGVIVLDSLTIDYYSKKEEIQIMADNFELILCPDDESSIIKKEVIENGGIIISDECTVMGRLIVVQDPAKLTIVIFPEESEKCNIF